ncbi:hypothetical protein ACVMII_003905 [Bradyrhizobium diazoefficiens]
MPYSQNIAKDRPTAAPALPLQFLNMEEFRAKLLLYDGSGAAHQRPLQSGEEVAGLDPRRGAKALEWTKVNQELQRTGFGMQVPVPTSLAGCSEIYSSHRLDSFVLDMF